MNQNPDHPKILIVEDEHLISWCLVNSLKNTGYEITLVESGQKGIERLSSTRFNLVITNMNLPDITGCDVALSVREHEPDTPVIVIGTEEERLQCEARCYDYFIEKPFDLDEVTFLINTLILFPNSLNR